MALPGLWALRSWALPGLGRCVHSLTRPAGAAFMALPGLWALRSWVLPGLWALCS
ncbi:hypothetical protein ACHQI4_24735 [Raoultella planticola]|uniref:hypothetical protein n=1 Tax=Raoultella planticola TaxID=575 RepID=UPI00388D270A